MVKNCFQDRANLIVLGIYNLFKGHMSLNIFIEKYLIYVWIGLIIFCSLKMYGFYHPDEFGQITSFLMFKLGHLPEDQHFWEFHERMRPWIQVSFYYIFAAPYAHFFGFNHYNIERLMLVIDASLVLLVSKLFFNWLKKEGMSKIQGPLLLMITLWFLPTMILRHSSEAFSTLLILLSLIVWAKSKNNFHFLLAGFLAGLSFWSRFQIGFFVAGFWISHLLFSVVKEKKLPLSRLFRKHFIMALGIILAWGFGVIIDYWGYGEWTFAPWNYFEQNIILKKTLMFGKPKPWHWYFERSSLYMTLPHLWLLIAGAFFLVRKRVFYFSLLIGFITFVLSHLISSHKEIRFLFPMTPIIFLILIAAFYESKKNSKSWLTNLYLSKYSWMPFILLNIPILIGMTLFTLVPDRFKVIEPLKKLPNPTQIIYSFPIFSKNENGFGESQIPLIPGYTKPSNIIGDRMPETQYFNFCTKKPDSLVLLTSLDEKHELFGAKPDQRLIDIELPTVWQSHPKFLETNQSWYHRLFRWKLIPCSYILKFSNL